MKAIIIAAGIGKRMRPLTDNLPKCMLAIGGRPLLEIHLAILRSCGINDISVVRGYRAEKIKFTGLKYYFNDRYEYNNILNSLFYAESELNDDVVVTYSDIYYEKRTLEALTAPPQDISIAVDMSWRDAYVNRTGHPIQEAEKVRMSADGNVEEIGKRIRGQETAEAEFTGMMKLSKKGCAIFRKEYHEAERVYSSGPFHEAASFEKAYLTDMLQELAEKGIGVHCVRVKGAFKEIDTLQDYENIKRAVATDR